MSLLPFIYVFVTLALLPKVFSLCSSAHRELYNNMPLAFANNCFTFNSFNCTSEVSQWNNISIPVCSKLECGLHLNAYLAYHDANGNFPRFALNITISESLHEPLKVMYKDVTEPHNAKCFSIFKNSSCMDVHENKDVFVTASPDMASDSYTSIKFLINGKRMEYKFKNLYNRDLEDGVIFFYTHADVEDQQIIITLQTMANIQNYVVKLCHKGQKDCIYTFVDLLDNSTYAKRFLDLVTLQLSDGKMKNGDYELSVECQSSLFNESEVPNCCKPSKIYGIKVGVVRNDALEVVLPVILIFLLVSFSLIITVLHCRREVLKPMPSHLEMLLVYDAASVQHTDYVKATRKFLRDSLGIEVLLDVIDVPLTDHKSPPQWYFTMMERADLTAFVLPPRIQPGQCRGSPFHDTYQLCLNLLESALKSKVRPNISDRYLAFVLPDSDPTLTLPFAKFMTKFHIPFDYYPIRHHIQSTQGTCRVRLPRWLLFNDSKKNNEFFQIVDRSQKYPEKIPFLSAVVSDVQDSNQINEEEERLSIQRRTKQLDDIFGNGIARVCELQAVIHPSNTSDEKIVLHTAY